MESVIIPVSQGGFVAATLWQRHKAKALVIVHPATAVVQGFYKGFAEYLYKRGFSVITYDYRGTGLSKSGRVRHNKNTMSDWIEQDARILHFDNKKPPASQRTAGTDCEQGGLIPPPSRAV